MFRQLRVVMIAVLGLALAVATQAQDAAPGVVNIYTARHYGAMESTFAQFTQDTGIVVRVSQGSPQSLLERLRAEGAQTPADLFMSIDAGTLALAAEEGLLQPVDSAVLAEAVPADLRDPENHWFAFSQRFRTIMINPEAVTAAEVPTYESLADPAFNGRLCLRPATHIYAISLVGSLIAAHGVEEAERIVAGWVANNPQYIDSDTEILNTLAAGGCDVAITNHYYLARLLTQDASFMAQAVWANQGEGDRGVFRNVSGAGVTANAANRANAVALLEWMATTGQAADSSGIPGSNYEYPVAADAALAPILEQFGTFTIDPLPLDEYGALQIEAIELLERAGYGDA